MASGVASGRRALHPQPRPPQPQSLRPWIAHRPRARCLHCRFTHKLAVDTPFGTRADTARPVFARRGPAHVPHSSLQFKKPGRLPLAPPRCVWFAKAVYCASSASGRGMEDCTALQAGQSCLIEPSQHFSCRSPRPVPQLAGPRPRPRRDSRPCRCAHRPSAPCRQRRSTPPPASARPPGRRPGTTRRSRRSAASSLRSWSTCLGMWAPLAMAVPLRGLRATQSPGRPSGRSLRLRTERARTRCKTLTCDGRPVHASHRT